MLSSKGIVALALLALGAAAAPAALAADGCDAEVRATPRPDQTTDEAVTKVFAVVVSTRETCAEVVVDFTATEQLFNGEDITITRRGSRKITSPDSAQRVELRIARDSKLVDSKFEVVRCTPCLTTQGGYR